MTTKKSEEEENVQLENMQELITYFDGDPRPKKDRRPDLDSFSLITFLEDDGKRLDKLTQLFGDKLNGHKAFNQTQQLLEAQEKHNLILENELVQFLINKDSNLNIELGKLWNQSPKAD
ncbi:MAG: hypothetical protein ACOYL6_07255 [Bacteriovoracaceae bacterium]